MPSSGPESPHAGSPLLEPEPPALPMLLSVVRARRRPSCQVYPQRFDDSGPRASRRAGQIAMDIAYERCHPGAALAPTPLSSRRLLARRLRGRCLSARPYWGESRISRAIRPRGGRLACGRALPPRAACGCLPRGRLAAQIGEQRRLDVAPHIALPAAGTNRPEELRDLPVLGVPLRIKPQTQAYGGCLHARMVTNGGAW